MTLSKAEKNRRAATRAKNAADKAPTPTFDNSTGLDLSALAAAKLIAAPAIKKGREIPETGTVTVACKLPNGLLLRIFAEQIEHENVMGGGTRAVKVHRPVGDQVRIQGYAVPVNKRPRYLITNGDFALTEGVDAKFFKTWWLQNEESALVKSGLIFCMADKHEAEAKADSREGIRNGLEPMAQGKDPRAGKTVNPNLTDVESADPKALKALA